MHNVTEEDLTQAGIEVIEDTTNANGQYPYSPNFKVKTWRDTTPGIETADFVMYQTLKKTANGQANLTADGEPQYTRFGMSGKEAASLNIPVAQKPANMDIGIWPVPQRPVKANEKILNNLYGFTITASDPGDANLPPVTQENQGAVLAEIHSHTDEILAILKKQFQR